MSTLAEHRTPDRATAAARLPRPFWNPYLAGFLLGLVLLGTYLVTGRGLGATAGFAGVATWLASLMAPAEMQTNVVHAKYWNDGAPLLNWTLFLLVGAIVGAALSGWQGNRFKWSVERGPRVSDGQRLALAFIGGFVAAWGAKIAKGCTSGQALTGGSLLNVGSLVFMLAVFAGAYGFAYFLRKEWL
ncbi:MAG: YeeE/YedE family protein [Betaproteobacteria bacterium]|nr:YeeE/YedE family protein [Betaproteobacteria bacterium]